MKPGQFPMETAEARIETLNSLFLGFALWLQSTWLYNKGYRNNPIALIFN